MEQLLSKEFLYEPLSDMAAKVNPLSCLPFTRCVVLQDLENQFAMTLARVAVYALDSVSSA